MSNPGGINLNTSPYFDDYDEDKKFVRVLYRPGRAVQARELSQSQTYNQKQIQRFANYFFKEGSIVDGCEQVLDVSMDYVKLQTTFNTVEANVANFLNQEIVGANTGIRAFVNIVNDLEGNDPKTLFINYLSKGSIILIANQLGSYMTVGNTLTFSTGDTATIQGFQQDPFTSQFKIYVSNPIGTLSNTTATTIGSDGNPITIDVTSIIDKQNSVTFENSEQIFTKQLISINFANAIYANTAELDATQFVENRGLSTEKVFTKGSKFTIGDGVVYIADHFVKNTSQTIILEKYRNQPSYKVGFVPVRDFIDSIDDTTLVDNAQGTPNFQAPGADRLKIDTVLTKVALNESTDETDFVSFAEVESGILKRRNVPQVEVKLAESVARRTFEESGNYTLSDSRVFIREHLQLANNGGRFTVEDGGNNELLLVEVDPFVSYVRGYRNEILARTSVSVRKGLDTKLQEQLKTQINIGNYIQVKESVGSWDIMESTAIELHNTTFKSISNVTFDTTTVSSATKIGSAKIKSIEYISGTPGTANAVYNFYLYDVAMDGSNLFENVRGIYDSASPNRFADVILTSSGASLRESAFDRSIFPLPYTGIKTIRDENNNVETGFRFAREYTVTFTGGVATISTTDSNESFIGSGVLTENQKNENYFVQPISSANTAALTGTVAITANTKIVVGVGTQFTSQYNVGDVIRINSLDRIISTISNNTYLTIETNHTGAAAGNTHFKVLPAGNLILLGGVGSTGSSRSVNVTAPGSVQIDVKEAVTFSARVVVVMDRANAREMKKILNPSAEVQIQANTHPNGLSGPFSLGYGDVYKIRGIYQSENFVTPASTSNTEVTLSYDFDNGQKDNSYEHGTITPKIGVVPTGRLLVVFDHFTHDTTQGVGYLSVDSYPIDDDEVSNTTITTSDIPRYTSTRTGEVFDLRDSVDFRPIKSANTTSINPIDSGTYQIPTGGLHSPIPSSDFDCDLIYYRGRVAKVFIDTRGNIGINDGVPGSPRAVAPPAIPDTLEVCEFEIPPYPSIPTQIDITPYKNKRFTMKDISKIQDRIEKLEYYTSLNLLEKEAQDVTIIDDDGLDRFKNGILVDPFTGHNVADVTSTQYRAAINRLERYVTAYTNNEIQISLSPSTQTNAVITNGNKLFLNYTEEVFAEQPYASTQINLAQELTFTWIGSMDVVPSADNWLQTTRDPQANFVVDLTGQADNWRKLVDAWNTEVAPLNRHWVGVAGTTTTTGQIVGRGSTNRGGQFGRGQTWDVRRDVTTQREDFVQQLAGFDSAAQDVNIAVDRVSDVSINHFMRPRDFVFEARGVKDATKFYAFFDGVDVTANVRQIRMVGSNTIYDLNSLMDNNGLLTVANTRYTTIRTGELISENNKIVGVFRVPANTFFVGQRDFKISDDFKNRENNETSYARKSIFAQGLSIVKGQDILNTRPFSVTFDNPTLQQTVDSRVVQLSSVDTIVNIRNIPPPADPLSQSFYVDENAYSEGIFLTSIDIYFKTKSTKANLGVELELREMVNGFPTRKVIGGEISRRDNNQIVTSANASLATNFSFVNPVYLPPGTEYCFTIKPDASSTDFEIWVAELGQLDITNPSVSLRIDKQPAAGVVFTSSNDLTWSVRQNLDVKFKMNVARFTSTGSAILTNKSFNGNETYNAFTPNIENLVLNKTLIQYEARLSDPAYRLSEFDQIKNLERSIQTSVKLIANGANETSQSVKSVTVRAGLNTQNPYISPYIDLQRMNLVLEKNVINNETFETLTGTANTTANSAVIVGSNTAFTTEVQAGEYIKIGNYYRQISNISNNTHLTLTAALPATATSQTMLSKTEELPSGPYASESRYITRRVTLNDGFEASDLVVYLNVNRPGGTGIKVYYKILNDNDIDPFDSKFYDEMVLEGTTTFSQDVNSYVEEKYVIDTAKKTGGSELLFGTVTTTTGSVDLVGTSTRFLEDLKIGDIISVGASGPAGTQRVVASITNNNFLTVESAFSANTSTQEVFKVLNNTVSYTTLDGRTFNGFKYFAIKIVFLSDNISFAPRVRNLRAIALA